MEKKEAIATPTGDQQGYIGILGVYISYRSEERVCVREIHNIYIYICTYAYLK